MAKKILETIFLIGLLTITFYSNPSIETSWAAQPSNNHENVLITYTNSSFTIESATSYGNLSFVFSWENLGTYIEYNGSRRQMRELKQVAFRDMTEGYTLEYWIPRLLYEYMDVDQNGLFTGSPSNETFILPGPDIFVPPGFKINTNIDMTNVTLTESVDETPICEWSYTQLAMPMEADVQGPLEKYPVVKEVFHYFPLNGTLKMDIILDNFRPRNDSSRLFISYGVRFFNLAPGKVTVAFDQYEFTLDQIDRVFAVNSSLIKFKVDGVERGIFDFGGKLTVDGASAHLNGSIGPADLYWLNEKNVWLAIGLNYPHVNKTMVHDPYFGLLLAAPTSTLPLILTAATALVSVVIFAIVILDYRKTKSLSQFPRHMNALSGNLPELGFLSKRFPR